MYKIAVMGDYDSIYGFSALGMDTFPLTDAEEAAKTLRRLANSEYGIVYITEQLADMISREIQKYNEKLLPAIILIPGLMGNTGNGVKNVKKSVEQAVGADILFGN
ncbi:MAG: V-type ATP synthase subunit F [Lachnospiraceae bacterium]|nr:V-type ATP synthase subunit F [Lachnospiraceae bacterium]